MVVTRRTDGKPAGKRATVVDDDATGAASTGLTDEAMQQRMIRMLADANAFKSLTRPEIRALYEEIEAARDLLSRLLDKVDGKHV
jgi:hypothetical protein